MLRLLCLIALVLAAPARADVLPTQTNGASARADAAVRARTASTHADVAPVEVDVPLRGVWLLPATRDRSVEIDLFVLAGERDAGGPAGLAHVLEHIVYAQMDRGPDKRTDRPGETVAAAGSMGGHGGQGGAFALPGMTHYTTRVAPERLESGLRFVARALEPLQVDERFLRSEKGVVAQEYNMRVGADPIRGGFEFMRPMLYGRTPFARSTIGTPPEIARATPERLRRFHAEHYVAQNAVLVVSGPVDAAALREAVEAAFGDARTGERNTQEWRAADLVRLAPGRAFTRRSFDIRSTRENRLLRLAFARWDAPEAEPDALRADVLMAFAANVVNSALPGSLRRPLQYDAFVARSLQVTFDRPASGFLETSIVATAEADVPLVELSARLDRTLREASEGLSDAVFERVRRRMLRLQRRVVENPALLRVGVRNALAAGADPRPEADRMAVIESLSKPEVDAVLRAMANPARSVEFHLNGTAR